MEKWPFKLLNDGARQRAVRAVLKAPEGWSVVVSEPTRTLDQNATQWPILDALSKQLEWPVDGEMVRMTDEEWKDVLTAAFCQETVRLAKGVNGGVVMLGRRTSDFSVREFSDWIEFLYMFAAERNVTVYQDENSEAA